MGNSQTHWTTIGARTNALKERQPHDYYATDPDAVEDLLKRESFSHDIWECANGGSFISNVLEKHGFNVRRSDLYDYGIEDSEILDFFKNNEKFDGDIITNPPYGLGWQFTKKAIETVTEGHKVAMFLKVTFLEGQERYRNLFAVTPRTVYVYVKRRVCAMNGDFASQKQSAIAYAWYVWEKGFTGEPRIRWITEEKKG